MREDSGKSGSEWGHFYLVRKIAAESDPGAAYGTDEIPAVGEFSNLKRLAEAEVTKLITGRAFHKLNLKITSHLSLRKALQAV